VALSHGVELALRRALVGEVPDFVSAITAEGRGATVVVNVYHLATVRNGWRQEFEQVVESEFEQHLPGAQRVKLSFVFQDAGRVEIGGPMCVLHRRP
jgi:hypothetical protein